MGTHHQTSDGITKQQIADRIAAIASAEIRLNAMIICSARDPFAMINLMRSHISDPDINGGRVPPFYFDLAETAVRCRAASRRSKDD